MFKNILNILQIPLKITILLVMVFGIYSFSKNIFINEEVDYGTSFKSLPEDSMDIIVLGSSHAQFSYIPSFVYEDTGLYSYVLGSACQPLEVSVNMLKEALKTQSPKMVILEVYTALPLRSVCEADSSYITAEYQMTGDEKYCTIDYLGEDKALTYYNDFINYHNNWINFDDISDLKQKNYLLKDQIDNNFGYVFQDATLPPENYWEAIHYDIDKAATLDELDLQSLNEIYEICKDNNIELLLYKTPIDGIDEKNQSYLNAVWKWADEYHIPYFDFLKLQNELDFKMYIHSDSYHAHINGANKITSYISDYINSNINIFNHKNNDLLDTKYHNNFNSLANNLIHQEYNPMDYLKRIKDVDDVLLVKYDYQGLMNNDLKAELYNLGVETSFNFNRDYYALIKDNKVLISSYYPIDLDYQNHHIIIDDKIIIDNNELDTTSLSIVGLNPDYKVRFHKNIDYLKLWDSGHDYYN